MKFIVHDTSSNNKSDTYPSTETQRKFSLLLAEECRAIGLTEVVSDEYGYVTATLPSNIEDSAPTIGFLAHMDTSQDAPGSPIDARIVKNYDGGDIALNERRTLSPAEFPHMKNYVGQDIIVTDGNTLLGADDKAGIAEILTAMEYLIANPEIKHGCIRVGFTPDEEIGKGVNFFDVEKFGADFAYTLDGGEIGELESENFNAARAVFTIEGKSVHPGLAKNVMRNAAIIAAEMIMSFPPEETPAHTEEREGFYHLAELEGGVGQARFSYILRDFDADGFEQRKAFVKKLCEDTNKKYGADTVRLNLSDEYRNMHEILRDHPQIIQLVLDAMKDTGIKPIIKAIRGGTDGARLSYMGLPCPNIFTGGHNFHGPYEYIPIQSMEAAVKLVVRICERAASVPANE